MKRMQHHGFSLQAGGQEKEPLLAKWSLAMFIYKNNQPAPAQKIENERELILVIFY